MWCDWLVTPILDKVLIIQIPLVPYEMCCTPWTPVRETCSDKEHFWMSPLLNALGLIYDHFRLPSSKILPSFMCKNGGFAHS